MKKIIIFTILVLIIVVLNWNKIEKPALKESTLRETSDWLEYKNNPVIKYKDVISNILWNDPSVIKEWDIYKMWLSGWDPFSSPIVVKIYYASSNDWINWNIRKKPVFESSEWSWDSKSVETPSVIKVWEIYHMYYTWYNTNHKTWIYSIWHATSKDWINWIKDENNPIIIPDNKNPVEWWYYTTAEPAIVYHNDIFYLYYVSAKSHYPEKWSWFWVMVATSENWSLFENHNIAHSLTSSYDKEKYRWYSTPSVYVKDDIFYMYHDLVYDPNWFQQVWISSAKSIDWINFKELDINIFTINNNDWKNISVLAPSVISDGNKIKMWFSGQRKKPKFDFGIWYATKTQ